MTIISPEENSILRASQKAIEALSDLLNVDAGPSEDDEQRATTYKLTNEKERLEIWIGEHGVLEGRLDHKLREASPLRGRVLSLLRELSNLAAQHVSDSNSLFSNIPKDRIIAHEEGQSTNADIETQDLQQSQIKDDQSTKSNSLSVDTNFTPPDSLPDSPSRRIRDVVDLLFGLDPSLLDPAPHDRVEQPTHAHAALIDINHVRERFSQADEDLIVRLGRANWERRQYLGGLRSCEDEEGLDRTQPYDLIEADLSDSASAVEGSERSASDTDISLPTHPYGEDKTLEENILISTSASPTATTTTRSELFSRNETQSTAGTEFSKGVGKASQTVRQVNTRYRVPLPPGGLTGKAFQCPFCSHMLSNIESLRQWKKHIFADLEPYMCTYKDCILSSKTYDSRKSWWKHEIERHRVRHAWVCNPCEQKQRKSIFDTSAEFEKHFGDHEVELTPTQIRNIRDVVCQRNIDVSDPSDTCPLCKESIPYNRKFGSKALDRAVRKHVADHLEQLAFFVAFPAGQMVSKEGDPDFQDDSDSDDDLKSEIKSIVSKGTHWSKKEIQIANVNSFIADQQKAAGGLPGTSFVPGSTSNDQQDATRRDSRDPSPQAVDGPPVAPSFPIRIFMHPPNEHFYSRQSILFDADKALASPGSICIFHGVGGVGKTLAAVQYIYAYQAQYDAIFWLQADTAPGLSDSYLQMVVALGLVSSTEDHHQVIDKGRNWLQQTERRWLLVFDNTLHWSDISRYMPNLQQKPNGSVLITAQSENLVPFHSDNVTKIRLEPLGQRAGSEMLLRYLGRDVQNDPERHLAREISAFVGGLPVAIAHVAGYVGFEQYSLEELILTFRQWRKRAGVATDEQDDLTVAFREASFSYDGMLAMVWEVTLRELSQDAREVLNLLAYLNCAAVPEDMLWGVHEDPSLSFLDARESLMMRRINNSLKKRRLVDYADSTFSMHRSLQRYIREKLSQDKNKQQTVFNQVVGLVREKFPRSNALQQPSPEKWSVSQKLLPHLYALHDVYHEFKPHIKGSLDFAQLFLDGGMDQFEQGITHEGLLLLKTSEGVLDTFPPEEHEVMKADIHVMIAVMYDSTGIENRQEALTRRKQALEIRRRIFEESKAYRQHHEMLLYNIRMEYAISLLHYHRYGEAEPIIENCLTKYREWGTEDDIPFEYAKYYNKIALVRMYQGRFDDAIGLAERSVQLMEQAGYNMFKTRFEFDLACIILQSQDPDRALSVHKEIYDQRIATVGPTNELTLHSIYAIGAIYEMQGKLDEAEFWLRKAVDQRRGLTSWPDEAFSRAQYHLASVLLAQGRAEDIENANHLREKSLRVLHRLLPLDIPSELEGVTDEAILFDHMLPISPGGPRFTGRGLLEYFMPQTRSRVLPAPWAHNF